MLSEKKGRDMDWHVKSKHYARLPMDIIGFNKQAWIKALRFFFSFPGKLIQKIFLVILRKHIVIEF